MKIKCWGSRGSIPVCGPEYIKYGGNTTCIEIQPQSGDTIIVDAGTGIRRLGIQLLKQKNQSYHLLFTHAHWDHIMGLPFFKPLHVLKTKIKMYHCRYHARFIDRMLSDLMSPPYFPIPCSGSKADIIFVDSDRQLLDIGSVRIECFPISHPNGGSGYKFTENGKTFVFLTDNELGYIHPGGKSFEDYRVFCQDADLLIHDAEYTPQEYNSTVGWGHSSYMDTLKLAMEAGVGTLGLFHLNQERTDHQMDVIVAHSQELVAAQNPSTKCMAVAVDSTFEL
ncbi:MAG: MBL fold metallo-hydrolase [Thermodesulfobacteriota bacterium]|nr:MBL fold metallo-hydrolase [Thermodesulfobacteriota bacterium]